MKRVVVITSPSIRIRATVNTDGFLTRDEIERLHDDLAERLMFVLRDVRYEGVPLSRIRVVQ